MFDQYCYGQYIVFGYRDDLAKPANELFLHNLTGILETAIRATNAQFDDPDILKRLDVRLLEVRAHSYSWVTIRLVFW